MIRSERYRGAVSCSFSLGQDMDESAAQAKYADRVLELTLPKKTAARQRKIVVR